MKPSRSSLFFLQTLLALPLILWLAGCETTRSASGGSRKTAAASLAAAPANEFRGAWIYDPRRYDPEEVMSDLKKAGMNAVFVRLSSAGAAYYPSSVLPKAPDTRIDYARAYADAGRRHGIKVHAWHVCFMMHYAPASAVKNAIKKGEVMRDPKGRAIRPTYNVPVRTPACEINRSLERRAAAELVSKYPLDGVQLDYVRYFSPSVDFSATSRARFERSQKIKVKRWPADVVSGSLRDEYHEFRTELLTSLVGEISHAVKAANPKAKVSAAVWHSPDVGRRDYAQDWVRWMKLGYLDFVVPMNYTSDEDRLEDWLEEQRGLAGNGVPVYCGLGSYMLNQPRQLNNQINLCRNMGMPGYVLYNYDERLKNRFLPELPN
ncbi:MAG: family 10 glycosylhydrolase [Verrucomicrobiae bacterium]|nr:family 10 glycosylhydrolase [Verrucomicrobiae bacterium]